MATTPGNLPQQPNQQPKSEFEKDASGLKHTLDNEAGAASSAMHDARDAVTGKASQYASEAKRGVMREAEGVKQQASESLRTFADSIREAGDKLSEDDQGMAAGFVRQAASGLERLSTSLGEKRFGDMVEDVRNFGRQNPTAFIAGSVLAGLAIGRFVRSTASDEDDGRPSGMRSPGREAGGMKSPRSGMGASSRGAVGSTGATGGAGSLSRGVSPSSTGVAGSPGASSGAAKSGTPAAGSSSASSRSPSSSSGSSAGGFGSSGVADQTRDISSGSGRSGGSSTSGGTGRAK